MKRIALFILPLLALVGCKDSDIEVNDTPAQRFVGIMTEAYGNITFTQGAEQTIRISGPSKMVKKLSWNVSDTTLIIKTSQNNVGNVNADDVHIFITAPDLSRVVLSGAGSFTSTGLTIDHNLFMRLDGAAKVILTDLQCHDLTIRSSGVGDITGVNLQCENADVQISGVGHANINVVCSNLLTLMLDGVGSITATGSTQELNKSGDGIGNINTKGLNVAK